MRYKLTIEYDGIPFTGWQIQNDGQSVQSVLTGAITTLTGEKTQVKGAGRTDSGVHARGQVAHIDLIKHWPTDTSRDALNAHLRPYPIAILSAQEVGDDFDARFSATKRHYLYRIINRRADLTLEKNQAWRIPSPLDAAAMQQGAQYLLGKHDFSTFRDSECQAKSPERTLDTLEINRYDDEIIITASARSFLHTQIRSMVGSLAEVGKGKWKPEDIKACLEAKDRSRCGPLAPPHGLYFMNVEY